MNYKKSWLILVFIILILAFTFQGSRGLWEPDEGRYVRCAYEMLQSGDWLTPRLNGNPHFSKPPLTYWLIATGLSLIGTNEWGARIFHAMAFCFTALMVGALGTRMWDQKTGILASLVYVTMIVPYTAANIVTTDTILAFFETAALFFFWFSLISQQNDFKRCILLNFFMWLFLGLAFLTKGPPGLIPLAVIIPYLWLTKNKNLLTPLTITAGVIIFAAVSLPWYFLVIQKHNGLLSYLIQDEVIGRLFTSEHRRNAGVFGAFKVYPHTLLLGALPWSYFWFLTIWKTRPQICTAHWWRNLQKRKNALFITLWLCVPLFILSVSNSRLPFYVLPLFAPLALASARSLFMYYPEKAFSAFRLQGNTRVYLAVLICLLLSSRIISSYYTPQRDSRAIWNNISSIIMKQMGDTSYELVMVDLNHEGLVFYSGKMVDDVTLGTDKSPSFSAKKNLNQKCDELAADNSNHIFLLQKKNVQKVISEFDKRRIPYEIEDGPFDYKLIFCERSGSKNTSINASGEPLQHHAIKCITKLSKQ